MLKVEIFKPELGDIKFNWDTSPKSMSEPVIAVDFETFYRKRKKHGTDLPRYTVDDLGIIAYVGNEEFDPYLVSIGTQSRVMVLNPHEVPWSRLIGKTWISHNAEFDIAVYNALSASKVVGDRYPPLPADHQWHCTADLSAYFQYPRNLAHAVEAISLLLDNRKVKMSKSVREQMDGRHWEDLNDSEQEKVKRYAALDAQASYYIWQRIGFYWPEHERKLSRLTRDLNAKGVRVNSNYVLNSANLLNQEIKEQSKNLAWNVSSAKQVLDALRDVYPGIPSTNKKDPKLIEWLEKQDSRKWIEEDLEKVWNIRAMKKTATDLKTVARETEKTGILYPRLVYFGAATGRWTSRGGLNTQTLKSAETNGVDVRKAFIPRQGKIFAIADFSQVEIRVYFWIVHDFDSLDRVRAGMNPYEAFARSVMGWNGDGKLKEVDPELYQLTKASLLSLGYAVGAKKFMETAKQYGIDLTLGQAKTAVDDFRRKYGLITEAWDYFEKATLRRNELQVKLPITFEYKDIKRAIYYRNIKGEGWDRTYRKMTEGTWKGNTRSKLYGGKIFQNMVSATARDIFGFAWLRCVKNGFNPILSIHDEMVFELDEKDADQQVDRLRILMEQPARWADSLPLEIDVRLAKEYGK